LLATCSDLGTLSNLVRNLVLTEEGGWWFDWDLEVVHADVLERWLAAHRDFTWIGIIDHENDVVGTEFQGGAPGNHVNAEFLRWLEPYRQQKFRSWSGPHAWIDQPFDLAGWLAPRFPVT
jgi:hypothetical protein